MIDRLKAEIERLRAYANHERSLGAEEAMIELQSARQEIERIRADVKAYANVKLSEENDRLIDEIKELKTRLGFWERKP